MKYPSSIKGTIDIFFNFKNFNFSFKNASELFLYCIYPYPLLSLSKLITLHESGSPSKAKSILFSLFSVSCFIRFNI
jgi:hypothetical protein